MVLKAANQQGTEGDMRKHRDARGKKKESGHIHTGIRLPEVTIW
jgi:hypothetical protein